MFCLSSVHVLQYGTRYINSTRGIFSFIKKKILWRSKVFCLSTVHELQYGGGCSEPVAWISTEESAPVGRLAHRTTRNRQVNCHWLHDPVSPGCEFLGGLLAECFLSERTHFHCGSAVGKRSQATES